MTILIPAYKPDEKLLKLLTELKAVCNYNIVVVDDGGRSAFAPIFAQVRAMGITVLVHEQNLGKGAALKTGFRYIAANEKGGCVTADADGQHLVDDILVVADTLEKNPEKLIIGARAFDKNVPLRSKVGNICTRIVFDILNNASIGDTQTGLRGIPESKLLAFAEIPGDRYEYEMRMLLRARSMDIDFKEVRISTVYLEDNASSHFNPVRDAMRVFTPVLSYAWSMFLAIAVDLAVFILITGSFDWPMFTIPFAIASASGGIIRAFGLMLQRGFRLPQRKKAMGFLIHFLLTVVSGFIIIFALHELGIGLVPAKLLSYLIIFITLVFAKGRSVS